jgi:hypothetical protein
VTDVPDRPAGPRRPPRPPKSDPAPTPAPADGGAPATPSRSGAARPRRPIPEAPGPRPDPPRRTRPSRPPARVARSGVRFREPPPAPVEAPATEPASPPSPEPAPAAPAAPASRPPARSPGRLRGRTSRADRGERVELPAPPVRGSAFRQRYGNPYDTQGPKVRMGALWAVAVIAALAIRPLRPYGLAILLAMVAGAAADQILGAHEDRDTISDRRVASFAASALPIIATAGARYLGFGFLGLVAAALAATFAVPLANRATFGRAGHIVLAAGVCGGAAASAVLLADYEIGAVIILFTFVLVYDASDFVVGSGSSNGLEGPLAGIVFIAAATFLFAEVKAPPFHGADIWTFSVLAMIACPLGQLVASALLPRSTSYAPALRRLDSLLVVAPAWGGLVGLYLLHNT